MSGAAEGKQVRITLARSAYANTQKQRKTLQALGLSRPRQSVVKPDNKMIQGMINIINHLVITETAE